jgi:hypothetical protein
VMAGGVDPAGEGPDLADARDRGQESEHVCRLPMHGRTVVG